MINKPKSFSKQFETARIKELYNLNILDTQREERFDRITKLVSQVFKAPIVLISLVDVDRQWFKSSIGLNINHTPRSISFCTHAIMEDKILHVPDATKDERFVTNPMVTNAPNVRFYAGAVMHGPTGKPVGTLCVKDQVPRLLTKQEQSLLIDFAGIVEHELCYNYHLNQVRKKVENALYSNASSGLPNQRLLTERLKDEMQPNKKNKLVVFSLAINRYPAFEKSYGLAAGKQLVKSIYTRLQKYSKTYEVIVHWNDDTFVGFAKLNSNSSLRTLLDKLKNAFDKPFKVKGEEHLVTCSIGLSLYPSNGNDVQTLVNNAHYARRAHAASGSSTHHFFSEDDAKQYVKHYQLENELIKAINNNTLELVYQPKVDVISGEICGAEALCRWNHKNLGFISPGEFIPVAESSELIIQLGEWTLRTACNDNAHWQANNGLRVPISVNVCQKQLSQSDFHKTVLNILKETELLPKYLDLEVTESALLNINDAIDTMKKLRREGVSFSLDDFGTGFSSLSYLRQLPLSTLKIDKSFVDNMVTEKNDAFMVHAIISLAKSLGLKTVAEGVEDNHQMIFLRAFQCDLIQGYFFSKPLSAKEFGSKLIKKQNFKDKLA